MPVSESEEANQIESASDSLKIIRELHIFKYKLGLKPLEFSAHNKKKVRLAKTKELFCFAEFGELPYTGFLQ